MQARKTLSLSALGLILCVMVAGCSSSSNPLSPLTIRTSSLTSATVGTAYSASLLAAGGTGPYTWSMASGNLPAGLHLSTGGTISGTPETEGASAFKVQATDASAATQTASASLTLVVEGAVGILTTSLPSGAVSTAYAATLQATGGQSPYKWSIATGTLPAGLTLNSSGAISGTPTTAGSSSFTIRVADSEATPATATAQLSIVIATVTITTTSLPVGPIKTAYNTPLMAMGGVPPYTWTITSGTLPAGLTLTTGGVISGTPTASGTSEFTVQVADSESPPSTASTTLSITVNASGNTAILKGNYAFEVTGFSVVVGGTDAPAGTAKREESPDRPVEAWSVVGSFVADGEGNITSGIVDLNDAFNAPLSKSDPATVPPSITVTGTYVVSSSGIGTILLIENTKADCTPVGMALAFSLSADGNGRVISYGDTTGSLPRGSGVIRKQDPTIFSLATITGSYAFGLAGSDGSQRTVQAGYFGADGAGNLTDGACDVNDGGTYSTCTFTGTLVSVDPATGRGAVHITSGQGTTVTVVYLVSATEFLMMNDDEGDAPIMAGTALQQTGLPFSNSSLSGATVMYYQDVHSADSANQSGAMLINFDGNGNGSVTAADEDLAGVITQKAPSQMSYTVSATGALSVTGNAAGFLAGPNLAFVVGTESNSILGQIEPQTGAPFSNASINGTVAGGSLPPVDYTNSINEADAYAGDGAGTLSLNSYVSSASGLEQRLGKQLSYTLAANGRGTTAEATPSVFYAISPTKVIVLSPKAGANLIVLEH